MSGRRDDHDDESESESQSEIGSEYEDSDDSYIEDDEMPKADLLYLCEEGLLEQALKRVKSWNQIEDAEMIQKQLFKINRDGNSALHEIMMGGSNEKCITELILLLVTACLEYGEQKNILFSRRPKSHGRTLLHWAAWAKSDVSVLRLIIRAFPEALCMRDAVSHGQRTPLEIGERYWLDSDIIPLLREKTASYVQYRVRVTVHLSVYRHFKTNDLIPMDKKDRKKTGMSPRAFFIASVLGHFLQRRMSEIILNVLSFLGNGCKPDPKRVKRKYRPKKSNKRVSKNKKKKDNT